MATRLHPPCRPSSPSAIPASIRCRYGMEHLERPVMVAQVASGVAGTPQPFVFKGVRYQPTPLDINGGAAGSPMGDFYYIGMQNPGTDATTMIMYQPI